MKINLCSGQRKFGEGWTNVDVNPKWEPDVVADGASMPMFPTASAELIVIQHGVEHFGLGEADSMLKECYRILAPGGSLIATTPDLAALGHAWQSGKITDFIYCVQLFGAYMDNEADRHKWGFSQRTLNRTIACGLPWTTVKSFDWRPLANADVAKDWYIIGAEGVK